MIVGKKVLISVMFDVVSIQISCDDEYMAQVLYDDLVDRMKSGDGVAIRCKPEKPGK